MEVEISRNASTPVRDSAASAVSDTKQSADSTPAAPAPRIEFPELRCPQSRQPIILVSSNPNNSKIFYSARSIIEESKNIDMEKLMVFDDFVRYLATAPDRSINMPPTEEAMRLASERKQNERAFSEHIESQKKKVDGLFGDLNGLYKEKCKELVSTLEGVLEKQKTVFHNHYSKYENQVRADKEREAHLDQFTEIQEKVSSMSDPAEVQEYIREVLRRKQAWEKAGLEIKTLGKRTEDHYRVLVENQMHLKPSFSNSEEILNLWKNGLDRLIREVKNRSGCITGSYTRTEGIVMEIKSINELRLLTNEMIKEDTDLRVNMEKTEMDENAYKEMGAAFERLTNLRYLTISFVENRLTASNLREVLVGVNKITGLREWSLNIQGNKLKNTWASVFAAQMTGMSNLECLSVNFAFNDCSCDSLKDFGAWLSTMKPLRRLTVESNANMIKVEGAEHLAHAVQQLTNLEFLSLNFGGYSVKKNCIKDEGAVAIVRAISHLLNLRELRLEIGFNTIKDNSLLELAITIQNLTTLNSVNLSFYSNNFEGRGAVKVCKALVQRNVQFVNINFHNNQLGQEAVNEIVGAFRVSALLTHLELNLRETDMGQNQAKNLRSDLNLNKTGAPFEKLEVHLSSAKN